MSGRQDPSYSEWVDAKELDESLRESVSMSNLKGKFTQKLFFDICFDIGLTSRK